MRRKDPPWNSRWVSWSRRRAITFPRYRVRHSTRRDCLRRTQRDCLTWLAISTIWTFPTSALQPGLICSWRIASRAMEIKLCSEGFHRSWIAAFNASEKAIRLICFKRIRSANNKGRLEFQKFKGPITIPSCSRRHWHSRMILWRSEWRRDESNRIKSLKLTKVASPERHQVCIILNKTAQRRQILVKIHTSSILFRDLSLSI